jgi:exopolysaccharide biosynthesis polyprenyl glycosylphosphotransferase
MSRAEALRYIVKLAALICNLELNIFDRYMADKNPHSAKLDQVNLFSAETYAALAGTRKKHYFNHNAILVVFDLLMALTAFFLGAWLSGYAFDITPRLLSVFHLMVFACISLGFFASAKLYSHHLIFGRRNHAKGLARAMTYGGSTILLIVLIYNWPQLFSSQAIIPMFFLFAIVVLLISRFVYGQMLNILQVLGISFLTTGVFGMIDPVNVPDIIVNWRVLPVGFLLLTFFLAIGRYILVHIFFCVIMRRRFRRQVLIVGHNPDTERIANYIIRAKAPYWISGTVGSENEQKMNIVIPKAKLGRLEDLPDLLHRNHLDEIIVTDPTIEKTLLISLIDFCTSVGIDVWLPPKILPIIDIKLYLDHFCGLSMVCLRSTRNAWLYNKIKHAFDAIIGLLLFFVFLPIVAIIAIAIKADTKGPVFYRPQVVGRSGRLFKMFKFRTMIVDSDPGVHQEYVTRLIQGEIGESGTDDQTLKITDDPRITWVGKFLRKLSLDELPQILNVVKGEMSLVGPRPCLMYEYELYQDWHKKRTKVRPGITGLWQVSGRSNVTFDDMILLDLYYVYNRSFLMDFNTLYETVFVVLQRKGAY